MKAVIIGGSGATGKELINQLLNDDSYKEIISLVRRKSDIKNQKLKEVIVDFNNLNEYKEEIIGNVAFSCLGTTLKNAGSKNAQWKIDFDYQYKFAELAKQNSIETFILVSSVGANSKSNFFYNKMKGSLENEIKKLNFNRLIIFQPPGLIRPNSDRKGENFAVKCILLLNKVGILKNYKPLHVKKLASAMIISVKKFENGNYALLPKSIVKLIPNLI